MIEPGTGVRQVRRRPHPGLPLLGRHPLLTRRGASRPAPDLLMSEPQFFPLATSLDFGEVAAISGATLPEASI